MVFDALFWSLDFQSATGFVCLLLLLKSPSGGGGQSTERVRVVRGSLCVGLEGDVVERVRMNPLVNITLFCGMACAGDPLPLRLTAGGWRLTAVMCLLFFIYAMLVAGIQVDDLFGAIVRVRFTDGIIRSISADYVEVVSDPGL